MKITRCDICNNVYVNLDEVIETVYQCRRKEANDEWVKRWFEPLKSLPTIDIVHCRECKYYEDPNHKIFENCVKWKDSHGIILPIKPNDSCSYGERLEQ